MKLSKKLYNPGSKQTQKSFESCPHLISVFTLQKMTCEVFVCTHPNSKTNNPIICNYETSYYQDMKLFIQCFQSAK